MPICEIMFFFSFRDIVASRKKQTHLKHYAVLIKSCFFFLLLSWFRCVSKEKDKGKNYASLWNHVFFFRFVISLRLKKNKQQGKQLCLFVKSCFFFSFRDIVAYWVKKVKVFNEKIFLTQNFLSQTEVGFSTKSEHTFKKSCFLIFYVFTGEVFFSWLGLHTNFN